MKYDYARLMSEIELMKNNYDFIDVSYIGKSVMGKALPCIRIGNGDSKIMLGGAYHALEYISAAFLMRFLDDYIFKYAADKDFFSHNPRFLYGKVSLFTVPMINPDGVDIALHGIDTENPYHIQLLSRVGVHDFASVWQANVNGVDLNHNYDAEWDKIMKQPSPSKYGGEFPECEPETKAVTDLIRRENFDMLLAFHSQGGEIYYDFNGMTGKRSVEIADKMAEDSGYTVCAPTGTAAFGGCKDWFIKEFRREGFTIEMGHGKNPLPIEMLDDIYEENAKIILRAMAEV